MQRQEICQRGVLSLECGDAPVAASTAAASTVAEFLLVMRIGLILEDLLDYVSYDLM